MKPSLPTGSESSPITELNNLGLAELCVQVGPKRVVCKVRVPEYRVGISQRDLLTLCEPI
jgi:hypothetical protein